MHKQIMTVLLAILGLVAVTSLTAPLWAARGPGVARGIVFQAKVDGVYQLFTIDPNGTHLRQITRLEARGSAIPGVEQPAWSPDGKTIIFDSDYRRSRKGFVGLFTIGADGNGLERIASETRRLSSAPAYSPDGKTISFDSSAGAAGGRQGIDLADADGSDVRRLAPLSDPNVVEGRSAWSPDGKWIAFTELRGPATGGIVKVRPDGGGLVELTSLGLDPNNAAWSPDGRRIAFNSHNTTIPGVSANIYVIDADGTDLRLLTHYEGGRLDAYMCDWSPDGKDVERACGLRTAR